MPESGQAPEKGSKILGSFCGQNPNSCHSRGDKENRPLWTPAVESRPAPALQRPTVNKPGLTMQRVKPSQLTPGAFTHSGQSTKSIPAPIEMTRICPDDQGDSKATFTKMQGGLQLNANAQHDANSTQSLRRENQHFILDGRQVSLSTRPSCIIRTHRSHRTRYKDE